MIAAIIFLFASIVFGYAVVRALAFAESREEEIALAVALGLPLTAAVTFALFLAAGGAAPYAAIVIESAAAFLLLRAKNKKNDLPPARGFWLRFLPFVVVLALFFANGAMRFDSGGSLIVSPAFYEDAYYHISFAQYYSFSGGEALPLQDPQYAGAPPGYPFYTDFYSAMLQRLGFDFPLAFVTPAFVMIAAFYAAFYFFAFRLSQNRNAAFCAVAMLFFSGAFAYPLMLQDASQQGLAAWLDKPARDYAALEENGKLGGSLQFTRAFLVAQRSSDFGYTAALVVFLLLFEAARERNADNENKNGEARKRKLLFAAGVLAGLTPFMRETAFYACFAVAAFTALIFIDAKNLKELKNLKNLKTWAARWAFFFIPCLVLALPQLPYIAGAAAAAANAKYVAIAIGWKAHALNPLKIAWFWIRSLGLPALLAVAGFALARRDVKKFYLAFLPLFAIVNVVSFTPDPMNNLKIINMWEIPTFALAGIALGALWKDEEKESKENKAKTRKAAAATPSTNWTRAAIAVSILFAAILPGALALWRDNGDKIVIYSQQDYAFAQWANAALPRDAVLLSFGGPHALDLVGRARVSGFPAIGWIKGRSDWYDRVVAVRDFYAGRKTCEVAREYGATHAVVTESERSFEEFNADALANNKALHSIYAATIGGRQYEVYEINC